MRKQAQGSIPKRWYRPEQQVCPTCGHWLKRHDIYWRKELIFLSGTEQVTSHSYICENGCCPTAEQRYYSAEAERLHLKHRRYSREVVIHVGYRRFWFHQTIYELHDWLTNDLSLVITERQVLNLIADFLALLKAGQPVKVAQMLPKGSAIFVGIDGMKPEQGNRCLYVLREERTGLALLTVQLDEGGHQTLSRTILTPFKKLVERHQYRLQGIVSDAQESIRMAIANTLPGVPHQTCQFHALRTAGELTFATDRTLKKRLKSKLRRPLSRVESSIKRLSSDELRHSVLCDYADCIRTTLLQGGIAPFELGGIQVFDALTELAASLQRCQKKARIPCSLDSWQSRIYVYHSPRRWPVSNGNTAG